MGEKELIGSGQGGATERLRGMRTQALLFGHALLGRSDSMLEQRGLGARRRCGLDTPASLPGCLSSVHTQPKVTLDGGCKNMQRDPFYFEID